MLLQQPGLNCPALEPQEKLTACRLVYKCKHWVFLPTKLTKHLENRSFDSLLTQCATYCKFWCLCLWGTTSPLSVSHYTILSGAPHWIRKLDFTPIILVILQLNEHKYLPFDYCHPWDNNYEWELQDIFHTEVLHNISGIQHLNKLKKSNLKDHSCKIIILDEVIIAKGQN